MNWQNWTDFFHIQVVMNSRIRIRDENSVSVLGSSKKGPDPDQQHCCPYHGMESQFYEWEFTA